MASPPKSSGATSPPYPQYMPLPANPRKRPSIHLPSGYNATKRRKQASIASGASSAHPLRQTSFPPEEGANNYALRSPSVETDITGFTGDGARSAVTGGSIKGKKRGRKSKKELAGSVAGKSKGANESVLGEAEDEDEEDDDGGEDLMNEGEELDREAERKNLSVLVDAFDADQAERYETFRRVKLRKETVRKIVNFTLAQSVPPAVITTINGYTKTFIGTLIERAREVQEQWAAIETPPQSPRRTDKIPVDATNFGAANPENGIFAVNGSSKAIDPQALLAEDKPGPKKSPKKELGPLLPDHLREALRRYRRDGEANATGLTGTSVGLGIPGTGSARLHGRRLFR